VREEVDITAESRGHRRCTQAVEDDLPVIVGDQMVVLLAPTVTTFVTCRLRCSSRFSMSSAARPPSSTSWGRSVGRYLRQDRCSRT
jgi:hypothetical protein